MERQILVAKPSLEGRTAMTGLSHDPSFLFSETDPLPPFSRRFSIAECGPAAIATAEPSNQRDDALLCFFGTV